MKFFYWQREGGQGQKASVEEEQGDAARLGTYRNLIFFFSQSAFLTTDGWTDGRRDWGGV
jgi:hypothetical protein